MKALPLETTPGQALIGRRLRALREARRLTVAQLAEAAGVSKGFLSRLELRTTEAVHLLEEGDTVTFPGREPHSWANPDDRPAVVLWTLVGHA